MTSAFEFCFQCLCYKPLAHVRHRYRNRAAARRSGPVGPLTPGSAGHHKRVQVKAGVPKRG